MILNTIKSKIFGSQLALVVLAVSLIATSSYFIMIKHLTNVQRDNLENIVDFKVEEIQHFFIENKDLLERASNNRAFEEYHISFKDLPLRKLFSEYQQAFPVMSFVDRNGDIEVETLKGRLCDHALSNIGGDPAFQISIKKGNVPVIGPVELNSELGEPAIRFIISRFAYFGDEYIGTLTGTVPLSKIGGKLKDKIGESGFITLIDGNGGVLCHPQMGTSPIRIKGKSKESEKLLSECRASIAGFRRTDILGVDGYVAYAPIKEMGWSVLVTLPYKEFMAMPNNLLKASASIFCVILVVSLILSFYLTNGITNPLAKFVEVINSVAKGDFPGSVEIRSKDEIGCLANAFNNMNENLNKAEKKLKMSEMKLAVTLDSIGDGVIAADVHGMVTRMNPVAEELTGWKLDEARGRPLEEVFKIINEHTRLSVESPAKRVLSEGVVVGLANHTLLIAKDGTELPIADSGAPIRMGKEGEIIGIVLVFRSMIAEREHQREIIRNERFLQNVFSSFEDGIAVVDKDMNIVRVNPTIKRWCSGEAGEQSGNHCPANQSQTVEKRCGDVSLTQKAISDKEPQMAITRWHSPLTGSDGWRELRVFPLFDADSGEIDGAIQHIRDITDRKLVEEELRHALKAAEAANKAKSEFLANMSHEVRTPLTAVIGLVDLLLDTEINDTQKEYLSLVKSRSYDLTRILGEILDLAKIEAERLELRDERFDLRLLLNEVADSARPMAMEKNIKICMIINDNVPRFLMGDTLRLRQVFLNLLNNAVKFTNNGEISLRAEIANGMETGQRSVALAIRRQ